MLGRIDCISISHKEAPLAVREKFARQRGDLSSLRAELARRVEGAVVLSTCGRFEIYVATRADEQRVAWHELLGTDAAVIDHYAVCRNGQAVVDHLLTVAAGLDSPLPGEDHILGQVRDAFLVAEEQGTTDPLLSALFRAAISCGRRVRRETGIRQLATSYAAQSVEILRANTQVDQPVVVVGSGTLAHEVAFGLRDSGYKFIEIVSRHEQRGRHLAEQIGCEWNGWNELAARFRAARAIVCCTSARQPIITIDLFAGDSGPDCLIDLGMPRNVEASVRQRCKAIFDLDSLPGARVLTACVLQDARRIIKADAQRYLGWLARREVVHEGVAVDATSWQESKKQEAAA